MSPAMRERLQTILPLAIAVVVPLAGLALAGVRGLVEHTSREAMQLVAAAVLGTFIWTIVLTSA